MDVLSLCRLPVGVVRWRSPAPSMTVIVKATFTLRRDGLAALAAEQQPLSLDQAGMQTGPDELFLATDFVPFKPRADVILAGHAHAPVPAWAIRARLSVNAFDKQFFALAGKPATSIPLAETHLRSGPSRETGPVQVCARAPWSPERSAFEGARLADPSGVPLAPLPPGFDYRVFNAAPQDQQIDTPLSTAWIQLEGLLPGAPVRRAQLPGIYPRVFLLSRMLDPRRAPPAEAPLRADTLWIDTDGAQCTLTFRGVVQLAEEPSQLVMVLGQTEDVQSWPSICDQLGGAVRIRAVEASDLAQAAALPVWPPDASAESAAEVDWAEQRTSSWMPDVTAAPVPSRPALPFEPQPPSSTGKPLSERAGSEMLSVAIAQDDQEPAWAGMTTGLKPGQVFAPAVPFKQTGPRDVAVADAPVAEQEPAWAGTTTGLKPGQVFAPAVPFKQADPQAPAHSQAPEHSPAPDHAELPEAPGWAQSTVGLTPGQVFVPAMPFEAPRAHVLQLRSVESMPEEQEPAWAGGTSPVNPDQVCAPVVPFAAAAGPLDVRAAHASAMDVLPFRSAASAPASTPPADPKPDDPPLLPIREYATIKAAFWAATAARSTVLQQHGLSELQWDIAEHRQMEALEREASEGRAGTALELLSALEQACGQLSANGGPMNQ